jgi:hypothetical protein
LLDESERDRRLLPEGDEPEYNGDLSTHKIDMIETATEKLSSVECNLKHARWEQVNTFFISFQILCIFIL